MLESLRHPLLDDIGRAQLERWREHPQAPRWNIVCGDRLSADDLEHVQQFALDCTAPRWDSFAQPPDWAREAARKYLREVPFYRSRGGSAEDWGSIAPCDRLDLAREPWHFVPDGVGLGSMVVYTTSGTTGSEARIPAHWRWPSTYLPLYERALELNGVEWKREREAPQVRERAALATIAAQEHTLTFASWSSYLDGAALKVNLHPGQWRGDGDAVAFLDEADPQVLCGDPVSLGALAATDFAGRPLAVISSAIVLSPGERELLRRRFSCPVVDIYGTSESGPLACSVASGDGSTLAILPPDVWIEILHADGSPCPDGEEGEVVLTGGRNPFLPLLRYRTGDRARGQVLGGAPHLLGLHGRALVKFGAGEGEVLDIDVTHALRRLPLREFSLHQKSDGSLVFQYRGLVEPRDIEAALGPTFPNNALTVEELSEWSPSERKLIRYSRESP